MLNPRWTYYINWLKQNGVVWAFGDDTTMRGKKNANTRNAYPFDCPQCGGDKHKDVTSGVMENGSLACFRCGTFQLNDVVRLLRERGIELPKYDPKNNPFLMEEITPTTGQMGAFEFDYYTIPHRDENIDPYDKGYLDMVRALLKVKEFDADKVLDLFPACMVKSWNQKMPDAARFSVKHGCFEIAKNFVTGRAFGNDVKPKWRHYVKKGTSRLIGANHYNGSDTIFIVEGLWDYLRLPKGMALGLCGKSVSMEHIQVMARIIPSDIKNVYVCLDGDTLVSDREKAATALSSYYNGVQIVHLDDLFGEDKDLDNVVCEMGEEVLFDKLGIDKKLMSETATTERERVDLSCFDDEAADKENNTER